MAREILLTDVIDLAGMSSLDELEKALKQIQKVYDALIKKEKSYVSQVKKSSSEVSRAIDIMTGSVMKLNPALESDQKKIAEISKSMDFMTATSASLEKKTIELTGSLNKLEKEQKGVNEAAGKTRKTYSELEKLQNKLIALDTKEAKEKAKVRAQINQKNKELREEAKNTVSMISVYDKQVQRLNQLSKEYKEYVVQGKESSRAAKLVKKEFDSLNTTIRRAKVSVGEHQFNVGKYPKNFALAARGAMQLASALGFTGVLFALVSAFRGAFNVIKNFDEEMTNLAAIAGETRGEFVGVEKEIRRVAKTSINTANDVSKTATALITLGKTKSEIVDLLEPVNNLSIALKASSEEAGQLLVGTLNAFGESSEAGQRYADIIAKVRTSTALDFEGIKDSLGFIAPVAKAVGVSMARTGAIIGTLVDANVKASRAGRLMSTSFGRLAKMGLTLDEALASINNSTNRAARAMELFQAESYSLALILADNIEKTDEYTKKFEDAGGTLDELSKKQLKSLSAQIKILGSAWEELVLSFENGEGAIAGAIKGIVGGLTDYLSIISAAENGVISWGTAMGALVDPIQKNIALIKISAHETLDKAKNEELAAKAATVHQQSVAKGIKTFEDFKKTKMHEYYGAMAGGAEILANISDLYNKKQQAVNKTARDGIRAAEQLAKANQKLGTEQEFVFESSEDIMLSNDELGKGWKGLTFELGSLNSALNDYTKETDKILEANSNLEDSSKQTFSKLEMFWIKLGDTAKEVISNSFEAASIIGNQYFDNQDIRRENSFLRFQDTQEAEIQKLESRKERELEQENLTASAKQAINKRYETAIGAIEDNIDRRQTKLRRKQAKAAKAQAIFQATINTAVGVSTALAQLNIPLAVIIGVLGGLQVGAIASEPLPAFEKGGIVDTEGPIITSEKGREMAVTPDGRLILTGNKGAEVRTDIPKGSEILNNAATERILNSGTIDDTIHGNDKAHNQIIETRQREQFNNFQRALSITLERENDYLLNGLKKTMSSIPSNNWSFDDKGHPVRSIQKGNTIKKDVSLNNKF